jgi:hypothetical protein
VKNPLKRADVFRCRQEAHRRFGGAVSAWHVLREKKCWPAGCLYFVWHCVRLEKGMRCPRRFTVPGRLCGGCGHYVEEKLHFQPERLIGDADYEAFLEDLEAYDAWFEKAARGRPPVAGRIATVKPWFEKTVTSSGAPVRLRGYLLVLRGAFIGTESVDGPVFVRTPRSLMAAVGFAPRMRIELTGEVREDRGRIVVSHPKQVEALSRGWGWRWTDEKALVSVRTATLLESQPEQCLACPWGALADVTDRSGSEEKKYRNLFCLKSVADPEGCYVRAEKAVRRKSA